MSDSCNCPALPGEDCPLTANECLARRAPDWFALMVEQVKPFRDGLSFGRRRRFDNEIRPILKNGDRIAYPDALYHITEADFIRAKAAVEVV